MKEEVSISLGDLTTLSVVSFEETGRTRLVLHKRHNDDLMTINLGNATVERICELQDYLERLKVHASDAKTEYTY